MTRKACLGVLLTIGVEALSGCGGGGGSSSPSASALVAQVSVQAQPGTAAALHYHWRATDGTIDDQDSASTTWTLPNGLGLHSAYVLVSNDEGGYTERRVVVSTDAIGLALSPPAALPLAAPPSSAAADGPFRIFSAADQSPPPAGGVYLVDSSFFLQGIGFRSPGSGSVQSDLRGEVVFPNLPTGLASSTSLVCALGVGAGFSSCGTLATLWPVTVVLPAGSALSAYLETDHYELSQPHAAGRAFLADGSPCGALDEFFGVQATGAVSIFDAAGRLVYGPARLDAYGGFSLPTVSNGVSVQFQCENAPPLKLQLNVLTRSVLLPSPAPPTVSSMTATAQSPLANVAAGTQIGTLVAPQTGLPSDRVPRADRFLTEKGIDSRLGSCQYYKAVGAVQSCNAAGGFSGAIAFDDWKRTVLIDAFAPAGTSIYRATFVNRTSLNLARVHASVSYGPAQTAAYVCNYSGPSSLRATQADIDASIDAAVAGSNLIGCFAMDYSAAAGVNGGQPYVRFLLFGPNGALLPSVNLDSRGEKFVPGVCVACHGGDHYAGKYPEDGSGSVDVGGHFVPYDTGNMDFSSKTGLTEADQELAIYHLNQNVLQAGPNAAISELIAGWYTGGSTVLNKSYIAPSWQSQGSTAVSFYQTVNARSCRSCHIALIEPYNLEHYPMGGTVNALATPANDFAATLCSNISGSQRRAHSMPNSMVTYNTFWLSAGTTADQPLLTTQLITALAPSFPFAACGN